MSVAPQLLGNNYPAFGTSTDIVGRISGWLATATTMYLYIAPIAPMVTIIRAKSTQQFDSTPYLVTCTTCILWVIYASLTPGRLNPLVTNGIGATAETCFLLIFIIYHTRPQRTILLAKIGLMLLFTGGIGFAAFVVDTKVSLDAAETSLGVVCTALNILTYASPLGVMSTVIRTRSVEFMPLGLSVATLLVSLIWAWYALWVGDLYIAICNNCGVALGIAQVLLYARYWRPADRRRLLNTQSSGKLSLPPTTLAAQS